MVVVGVSMVVVFCGAELGLNYREIDGYLSAVERSNYQDFDTTAIRNYLSASNVWTLRLYPKARTRKILLAMLQSKNWAQRYDAALGLRYLRDRTTIPQLVECLHIPEETDTSDQARTECANTLQMLLPGEYDPSVSHEEWFRRLEREAKNLNTASSNRY